jgi:hypothetical protein
MSARATALATGWAVAALVGLGAACRRDREAAEAIRAEIAALEREREALRSRVGDLLLKDPRLEGMPQTPVRVSVPTSLARELVEKLVEGFVDHVTLELKNLKLRKSGTLKKIVTLGDYSLDVTIDRVVGRLETGKPDVRFGGDKVTLALPIRIASGTGQATVAFSWRGSSLGGAVCGDLDITRVVSGRVRPDSYPLRGELALSSTPRQILLSPRLPVVRLKLHVDPSAASWAAVQKVVDDERGVCGFVLDRVDVVKIVRGLIDRGFDVRLPTEKVKAVAVPVGIEPTMSVRGQPVALGITVGGLAITPQSLWLGAWVKVLTEEERLALAAREKAQAERAPRQKAARKAESGG